MKNPFEFVNDSKNGGNSIEGYVYFPVLSFISSSPKYLPICNKMNRLSFSRLPDDIKASITNEIIRKYNKVYFSYPKQAKKIKDASDEKLVIICKTLKCSLREAKLYYERKYISDKDIKKMKELVN